MSLKIFKKYQQDNIQNTKKLKKFQKKINYLALLICKKISKGGKILTCGNGGSSCDAQHLVAELIVRLSPKNNRKSIPAIFLGMDIATITACGNDLGYDQIFSRSLEGIGKENDVLICYSTSGNSKNIIKVLDKSRKLNIFSMCFLGQGGGRAKTKTDKHIIVPSRNVMRIQESHLFLSHYLAEVIEKNLLSKKKS